MDVQAPARLIVAACRAFEARPIIRMSYRTCIKWLLQAVVLLAVSSFAGAQMIGSSDPWGPGSASGATGLQPTNSPTDNERVGNGDQGKLIQFKSQTTLVQVPVVVTDTAGKHIQGLTKDDFKVLENGKPQSITGFEEITPAKGVLAAYTSPAGTFTNLTPDETKPRSLTVIVLDEVNTPFLSQAYARGQLIKYLANHLDASQPLGLMVIGRKGLSELSGLDSDPAQLIAILKKAGGKTSDMEQYNGDAQAVATAGAQPSSFMGGSGVGESPEAKIRAFVLHQDAINAADTQARAIETTLRSFLSLSWSLSGVPGRKSLVWVTGSFPFNLDSFSSVPGDANLRALYERTLKSLNDAQISVYPLDARGLVTDSKYSADTEGSMLGPEAPDALRQASLNSLKNFADMTGGIAYYNTNDLASAFGRAVQDSSSYYLLSYYLDHRNNKPGWRKLQVVVSRKDAEVRARAGYLVTDVAVNPERTHKADVEFALISPFESTGIPITEQWQGVQADGSKKKIGFVLQVPVTGLIDEADKNRIDVEIVAQATNKGVSAGTLSQTMKGLIVPETLAKLKADGIVYRNFLALAPGDYQVRFVVRDNLSGRIGSVIVPLTVN
jgi:VWFA-related protein